MLRGIASAAIIAFTVTAQPVGGGPASTAHTHAAGGLRLTIAVGKRVYPRNALVRVTATLRNLSPARVYYPVGCNGGQNPSFAVIDGSGRQVDPPHVLVPAPKGPLIESCLAPLPRPILPGHSLQWSAFLLLRGRTIEVTVGLTGSSHSIFAGFSLSARLRVRLTAADPPRVTLLTSPSVFARLQPRGHVYGRPRIVDWWLCPGDNPANGAASRDVVPIHAAHVAAPCAQPVQWHAVVGWLGHSVVAINYPP